MRPQFATSYFGSRILRHVAADMKSLKESGFGLVVHTFSEEDLRFNQGTIAKIVSASKDAGLGVWLDPWGVGGVFGGEAFSDAALREPSWRQVDSDGTRLPACCPSNPGFQDFLDEWISAACATEADAIFWDEPHFLLNREGRPRCFCRHCEAIGHDSPLPILTAFLKRAFATVQASGKKSVLCLLPEHLSEFSKAMFGSLVQNGLQNIGTDPFWYLRNEKANDAITRVGEPVVAAAREWKIASHIWIQCFKVPSGRETEITQAVLSAAALRPDVIAVWGFEGCQAMSALACDRPEVAWRCFLDAMQTDSVRHRVDDEVDS